MAYRPHLLRLFFTRSVSHPAPLRGRNIFLLPLLGPTPDQNHNVLPFSPEIHAIPRTKVDLVFEDSATNALDVGKIAESQSIKCRRNLARRLCMQPAKPFGEGVSLVQVLVLANFNHKQMVTYKVPSH